MYYLFNSKHAIIDLGENYVRQTFRNRYKLAGPNGIQELIIPVVNTHQKTPVKDIMISYNTKWQKLHLKTIETIYNKSPFYIYYKDYFDNFFIEKYDTLANFNRSFIELIIKLLNLNVNIFFSDTYINVDEVYNNYNDLRNSFNPKVNDVSEKLFFPEYTQVFSEKNNFIKNISIIDVLFNLGPDFLKYTNSIKSL